MHAIEFEPGGFAYLPGSVNPFSNGVAARPGFRLTRVRLRAATPMAEGMAQAAAFLRARGLPVAAFAACELRSPATMSRAAFAGFNAQYVAELRAQGFGTASFEVARSNMAPQYDPPATNTLFAFTFAEPAPDAGGRDYVISGKPENTDTAPGVIAPGDVSPAGMAAKAGYVIDQLRARVAELDRSWSDITGAQGYTIRSMDGVIDTLRTSGLAGVGFTLFPAYPPVDWCEFEIDVRAVSVELAI